MLCRYLYSYGQLKDKLIRYCSLEHLVREDVVLISETRKKKGKWLAKTLEKGFRVKDRMYEVEGHQIQEQGKKKYR